MSSVLRKPGPDLLADYSDALRRGWSPDNLRAEVAQEQLRQIDEDSDAFLDRLEDLEAKGPPVTLPDGSKVARLPSLRRWIWKDGFCGTIGLRWRPGTEELPPTCLGHVGYAVVPWRRREGLATAAVAEILPIAAQVGLRHVDVTTDPDNAASIGVIEKAGGRFLGRLKTPPEMGPAEHVLFRIDTGANP